METAGSLTIGPFQQKGFRYCKALALGGQDIVRREIIGVDLFLVQGLIESTAISEMLPSLLEGVIVILQFIFEIVIQALAERVGELLKLVLVLDAPYARRHFDKGRVFVV